MIQSISRFSLIVLLQLGFYLNSNFSAVALSNPSESFVASTSLSDEPKLSPQDVIFEVKHSKSPNVVVYQANKTGEKLLNPSKPINVYWLMNTEGKRVEALTTLEWHLAFGFKLTTLIKGKKYKIKLNAIENKEITILQDENGKVDAFMTINGTYSKLLGVYIDFKDAILMPEVHYVEFSGITSTSNKKIVERILPKD